jgi:hypothetical protein
VSGYDPGNVGRAIAGVGAVAGQIGEDMQRERRAVEEAKQRADAGLALAKTTNALQDAHDEVARGVSDGSVAADKAEELLKQRIGLIRQNGLEPLNDKQRRLIADNLETSSGSLQRSMAAGVFKRYQSDIAASIDQFGEQAQRDAVRVGPKWAADKYAAFVDFNGAAAGLSEVQRQKLKQTFTERAHADHFTALGEQAWEAGDAAALKALRAKVRGEEGAAIDPARRTQLQHQLFGYEQHIEAQRKAEADRAAHKAEMAAAKREREANQAYTIASDLAREGKMLDPAAAKPLLDKMAGTPYAAAYAERVKAVVANAAVATLPLEVQRQRLDALKAKRNKDGTSPGLEHEIEASERIYASADREYQADPLRAASERRVPGVETIAPLDSTSIDTMILSIGPRVEQAGIVATRTGSQVSPLTSDEARRMKVELDALPPQQRSAKVAALAARVGPQAAQGLAAQLDKDDRALALAFGAGSVATTSGRYVSELILKGSQAKKDGTSTKNEKEPGVKSAQWEARVATVLNGMYPGQTLTDRTREAAVFIAHGMAAEQMGALSDRDLERAVGFAVGGRVTEHNGRRIPLPSRVSDSALERRLQSVTSDQIKAQAGGDTVRAGGVAVPVDEFVRRLPGAQLMYATGGERSPWRYMVIVGGRPVTNDKGAPILVGVE